MKPTGTLDGASVLFWSWSEPDPFFVMPYSGRPGGVPIHGLAIARYPDSGAIYRFSCNRDWEVENDSFYSSAEEAMTQESVQYEIASVVWRAWK